MSQIRELACGHGSMAIRDYTDDCRWVVRCRECGHEESWTQREWRGALVSVPPRSLIHVAADDGESKRLAIA